MMKPIKKISKKHYIQCGLAVLLTGLVLYFTSVLWSSKAVIVSFNAEAKKEITYQVFYQTTENKNYIEKYSISQKVKAGKNDVEIVLPTDSVKGIRLDFGSYPETVKVKDIKVIGNTVAELKDFDKYQYYKIDSKKIGEDGSLTIVSNQNDPFMYTNRILDVRGKCIVDWCRFIIISVLAFLLMYKFVQYLSKFKIEKQHSRIDIVMLAVFFALLFLPMSHISDAEKSEQENRMLAKKPQLTIDGGGDNNYGVQFDAWYNDHFFGRDAMMWLYSYINFLITPNGFSEKAMIGKDGWLFLKHFIYIYDNSKLFTDSELDLIGKNIKKFIEESNKLGFKKVYFLLSNVRETMYSEYYPSYVKKKGNLSRLKQLLQYMYKNYPEVQIFNFESQLLDVKKKETIFYKTGTHMNNIGAFYEYYFLTSEIKKDYPELNVLTLKDFDISVSDDINQQGLDLDLYRNFNVMPWYNRNKENFKNKILTLKPVFTDRVKVTNVIEEKPDRTFKTRVNGNLPYELTATVISDSFGRRYENYLPHSFSKVSHLYIGAAAPFVLSKAEKDYIINNPTDVLIIETVESVVERFLNVKFPQNLIKEN